MHGEVIASILQKRSKP